MLLDNSSCPLALSFLMILYALFTLLIANSSMGPSTTSTFTIPCHGFSSVFIILLLASKNDYDDYKFPFLKMLSQNIINGEKCSHNGNFTPQSHYPIYSKNSVIKQRYSAIKINLILKLKVSLHQKMHHQCDSIHNIYSPQK